MKKFGSAVTEKTEILRFPKFYVNFRFPWQRDTFLRNQTLGAKLDIGIQLPVKYQEGLTNGCGELERTKFGRRKKKMTKKHCNNNMSPDFFGVT